MDQERIARARSGDPAAFEDLIESRIDRLYVIAQRILRDPALAEDAVQAALMEAWRDLRDLRDPERLDAWLYRLVVRACSKEIRRWRRWGHGIVRLDVEPGLEDSARRMVDERDALDRAFRELSTEQRAVLVLHHVIGLPLVEVASTLGIPEGTARSRLHYGLQRLRAVMSDEPVDVAVMQGGAR